MLKIFISLFLLALGASSSKISPELQRKLAQNPTNIIIAFAPGTEDVLKAISDTQFPDRDSLLEALSSALEINAATSQMDVRLFLNASSTRWETDPLWVTNQLWVKSATPELIDLLSSFEEITEIIEDELTFRREPVADGPPFKRALGAEPKAEWGVDKVMAEEAVAFLKNMSANLPEVRICTIDTGVRYTHEALRDNYLGSHGWFDPGQGTDLPNDQNGHGTHTTGTIVGTMGIGVFPDAKWLACKGCASSTCSIYDMIRCGQYVLCPTLPDGSSPDCKKAPHLVSNSWGVERSPASWYDGVIAAWQVGRLIPIFSIGNSGPNCASAGYPGSGNVIGVGSTTSTDAISSFSSVGPSFQGLMKPDISAPGSNIVSASNAADDAYRSLSGTSMACPHIAGITAILKAYDPELSFEQIATALYEGADTNVVTTGRTCDGVVDTLFPNHVFGYGRANALWSLQSLAKKL